MNANLYQSLGIGAWIGACVGVVHVTSIAFVWAIHGYPDIFFRTPDYAIIAAVIMAVGGGLFGLVYGGTLAFVCRLFHLSVRQHIHFWAALLASLLITAIDSELSLQRRQLVSPLITIGLIVACTFAAAITTARRMSTQT